MNRILLVLLLLICFKTQSQTISGQVVELGTNKPVANAYIYFDGSFQGTTTDNAGNFKLKAAASNQIPLIVSYVGYVTEVVTNYSENSTLRIIIKPANNTLKEVAVGFDGMTYEEKLTIFKREYLGLAYVGTCIIENVDEIDFRYDRQTQTLTASAANPLIISNSFLGYSLKSFLNTFSYSPRNISYSGNQLFQSTIKSNEADSSFLNHRKAGYLGSRMHFIRSLWSNTAEANGFMLSYLNDKKINPDRLVYNKDNKKYLVLREPIRIKYKGRTSFLRPYSKNTSSSYIESNGFIDLTDISWVGDMANQRIGILLPFEYNPE